ncbi:MAG: hypothetical protein O7G85_13840 [Planctomycetota bacterium]|nr:hypothetical protein [Planctomycetota bacterium]
MTRRSSSRRGLSMMSVALFVLFLATIAMGGWWMTRQANIADSVDSIDLFETRQGGFDIIIPASGELAAISETEIRNEMEQRATIIQIVDEGVEVKQGDLLIQFNDEGVRTKIDDAEDARDNAINQLENAKASLEIRKKTRESDLAKADLDITLTELALLSWEEGQVVEMRQNLDLEQKTTLMEYDRLKDRFKASKRLYEQEFISLDEFKQDEIALVRAETRLKQAQLDIEIYEKYEYKQQREQKESDRQQAIDERDRIQQRNDANVSSAESDVRSADRLLNSRKERLQKWQNQLKLCTIIAPTSGLVIYTSSLNTGGHGRSNDAPPMVGTDVSSKKTIMILPDTSEMIAEVKVNEALSGQIMNGQMATIVSDAKPDLMLRGRVFSVGVLAETGGWRDPHRRDYTVKILIENYDRSQGLKPSMRCRADINVGRVDDATYVPIQAVHRQGPAAFVWIPDGRGYSQNKIDIGQASELYVEVLNGLDAGQIVLMREPNPKDIVAMLDIPAGPVNPLAPPSTFGPDENRGDASRGGTDASSAQPPAHQGRGSNGGHDRSGDKNRRSGNDSSTESGQ